MTEAEKSVLRRALAAKQGEEPGAPAAVLVPLVETAGGLALLYEVRSAALQVQPGEVCFPGGGMERGETPRQAALRETEEELGIPAGEITLLGELEPFFHSSMRKVFPIVGLLSETAVKRAAPAPAEVERFFTVPLEWLQSTPPQLCRYTLTPELLEGQPREVRQFLGRHHLIRSTPYWLWQGQAIWGLTARITARLLAALPQPGEKEREVKPDALDASPAEETVWKLESNIDDATGEALGLTMELLLDAGARDVYYQPIYMKKNRPAYQLNVLCTEGQLGRMEEIIFVNTTTIGIRRIQVERTVLERRRAQVETALGLVELKLCTLPNGEVRAYPEYESVAALCRATGRGYQEVYALAQRCWEEGQVQQSK